MGVLIVREKDGTERRTGFVLKDEEQAEELIEAYNTSHPTNPITFVRLEPV